MVFHAWIPKDFEHNERLVWAPSAVMLVQFGSCQNEQILPPCLSLQKFCPRECRIFFSQGKTPKFGSEPQHSLNNGIMPGQKYGKPLGRSHSANPHAEPNKFVAIFCGSRENDVTWLVGKALFLLDPHEQPCRA